MQTATYNGRTTVVALLKEFGSDGGRTSPPPPPPSPLEGGGVESSSDRREACGLTLPPPPGGRNGINVHVLIDPGSNHPGAGAVAIDGAFDATFLARLETLESALPIAVAEKGKAWYTQHATQ